MVGRGVVVLLLLLLPAHAGALSWGRMPASEILDREVVSRYGYPLGRLEDLVIDVRGARVHSAVIASGGWMGLGETLHAVPVTALAPEPGSPRLVLGIDLASLVNTPGFSHHTWPEDGYWDRMEGKARPPLRRFVRASRLLERATTDRTGEAAGEIEDVMLDLHHGVVLYFLFDYDESWGLDQPPLRLAPQVFSFPLDGGDAVINLPRERLADPDRSTGASRDVRPALNRF